MRCVLQMSMVSEKSQMPNHKKYYHALDFSIFMTWSTLISKRYCQHAWIEDDGEREMRLTWSTVRIWKSNHRISVFFNEMSALSWSYLRWWSHMIVVSYQSHWRAASYVNENCRRWAWAAWNCIVSTINVGVVNEAQVYNTSCASKQV